MLVLNIINQELLALKVTLFFPTKINHLNEALTNTDKITKMQYQKKYTTLHKISTNNQVTTHPHF